MMHLDPATLVEILILRTVVAAAFHVIHMKGIACNHKVVAIRGCLPCTIGRVSVYPLQTAFIDCRSATIYEPDVRRGRLQQRQDDKSGAEHGARAIGSVWVLA